MNELLPTATKTRRLKVYYRHHGNSNEPHPFIRLAGKYLSGFNFEIGDNVEVAIEAGRIVITKVQPNESQNA
jgi:antitoxin component of MazEF toxin-antitoxin module